MEPALTELKTRLGKLTDLRRAESVLYWDMTVFMPPGGMPTRAAQLATLQEITHAFETEFPAGRYDDAVDAASLMGRGLEFTRSPRRYEPLRYTDLRIP